MQTGNEIVDKISTMKLRAVEPTWYKTVVDEKGKTNLLSVAILSDTVYWYTWTEKVDETNNVISYEKKFADKDYVQRNYEQLEDMFNVTRKQVYTAILLLEKIGVIQRVFKSVDTKLGTLHNVMFLSVNPERLFDLSFPDVKSKKEVPVTVQEHEHLPESNAPSTYKETTPYSKVNTNTATTTVNTTVNTTSSSAQSKDCEKDEKKSTLTSQYKEIEKEYFDVWDKLYSEHKVATEKPIIDYRIIRSREKSLLSGGLTKNQLKSAIDAAVSDSFVMSGGFSLSVILSGTVINRLINGSKPSSDNDSVFGNNNPFELSDRHNRCASIDRSQEPGYWEDVMSMSFEERLKKAESSDNYFKGA